MLFDNIKKFFKKADKKENSNVSSKETAKERLHLVLMQDRANVSADFLDLMRQEIIEVIKKYIDVDESAIDVRLTNQANEDGTQGAPALYANIPIINIKDESKKIKKEEKTEENISEKSEQRKEIVEDNEKAEENVEDNKETEEPVEIKEEEQIEEEAKKIEEAEIKEEMQKIDEAEIIEEAKKIVEEENKTETSETDEKAE